MTRQKASSDSLGCGVGLRSKHYPVIMSEWPSVDWFEAITENYMDTGGRPLEILEKVRAHYPVALHGVALSIGSVDRLNEHYLQRWKALIERINPVIVSDHICWSGYGGEQIHDLLPLPFTEEALNLLIERTRYIQDFLGRQILLENVSSYVTFKHSTIPEWEFVRALAERSGCGLLLDINNVFVNATNHEFNATEYIQHIPGELVGQIHLAGHTDRGKYLFDTHSAPIIDRVWNLYKEALSCWGKKSTLIEWDENIPEFSELLAEAEKAREIYKDSPDTLGQRRKLGTTVRTKSPRPIEYAEGSSAPSLESVEFWMRNQVFPGHVERRSGSLNEEILNPQGGEAGQARLSVYREGYFARTHEALAEVYEAIRGIVGADTFWETAAAYAESYSSPNYNLNVKGQRFAEFLEHSKWAAPFPFLPDLARLEWNIAQSFHAFLKAPFNTSSLSALEPEDWDFLRISFQPSVFLLESAWPVTEIWQLRKTPENQNLNLDVKSGKQFVLIKRSPREQVVCELLDPKRFAVLKALLAGHTLGEALAFLIDDQSDLPPLNSWFSSWARDQLITECRVDKSDSSVLLPARSIPQ